MIDRARFLTPFRPRTSRLFPKRLVAAAVLSMGAKNKQVATMGGPDNKKSKKEKDKGAEIGGLQHYNASLQVCALSKRV